MNLKETTGQSFPGGAHADGKGSPLILSCARVVGGVRPGSTARSLDQAGQVQYGWECCDRKGLAGTFWILED